MYTDHELKPFDTNPKSIRERDLCERISNSLSGEKFSSVAQRTSYNPETVRRYFQGIGKIPADFIGQLVLVYDLNAHEILTGSRYTPELKDLQLATTENVIIELGRRIQMIESCAVSTALAQSEEQTM